MKNYLNTIIIIVLALIIPNNIFGDTKEKAVNNCLSCHKEDDALPEDFNEEDVHISFGLTCADCHGGDVESDDEDIAMSPSNGFVGAPDRKDIPKFCGKCHSDIKIMRKYNPKMETDQVSQYYTSIHGKELLKGNEDVAVCTSCHTAHSIFPTKDSRSTVYPLNIPETCNKCHGDPDLMAKYDLPSNVFEEYSKSVHGIALLKNKDISAPVCNDCHGNHGAIPPGVKSISYVCGECHVNNMNLFKNSAMGKAFIEMDFHGCVECHDNHLIVKPKDDFVGVGDESFCIDCHDEGEEGYEIAAEIYDEITGLAALYDSAQVKLRKVQQLGMVDENIEYVLKDVRQNLIFSRTAVHSFNLDKVKEKTLAGKALADSAIALSNEQIHDYHVRRNGLAASTIIFTLFALGLYLKIKSREHKFKEK